MKRALLQSAILNLEKARGQNLQNKLQLIEEVSHKADSTYTVKDWYQLLDSPESKELGIAFGVSQIGQKLRIPLPTSQMPEIQQTLARTVTGFDDNNIWRRLAALYENPQTKSTLVQISEKALGVPVSDLKTQIERALPQEIMGQDSPMKELIASALSNGQLPTLQGINRLTLEVNKKLVKDIDDQRIKLQSRLKVDQTLPDIYRAGGVADSTFTALKSSMSGPSSVDRAASAANALAALTGDASIAKAANDLQRVSTAVSQGNQIIALFASASTGVGALAAVGALGNSYGAFSAIGGPNQATGDHQVLEALSNLTKEMHRQFSIVNAKLDKVLDQLEVINGQLTEITVRLGSDRYQA